MEKNGQKLNIVEKDDAQDLVFRVVFSTAIKTLYYLFVFGVLVIILIMGIFPFKAMRFYESVGFSDRALYMADLYVARQRKKDASAFSGYADGLVYKMMLAEELYISGAQKSKYLWQMYDSTYEYACISKIDERNIEVDAHNVASIARIAHAAVFSFDDRVCNLNYFAALRLGKENSFLLNGKTYKVSELMQDLATVNESDLTDDIYEMRRYSIFFGQLTEYLNYCLNVGDAEFSLITGDNNELLDILYQKLVLFRSVALNYGDTHDVTRQSGALEQLYFVRVLGRLMYSLSETTEITGYRAAEFAALDDAGNGKSLTEFYLSNLLVDYIATFA